MRVKVRLSFGAKFIFKDFMEKMKAGEVRVITEVWTQITGRPHYHHAYLPAEIGKLVSLKFHGSRNTAVLEINPRKTTSISKVGRVHYSSEHGMIIKLKTE